jgi:D-3-phosphoglycerate dehydrogenase
VPLAERLGCLFASLVGTTPSSIEISATGEIGGYDTRILTLSALKGFFGAATGEQVTFVNAPQLAAAAGCEVRENNSPTSTNADYVNLVTLKADGHNIAATLVGPRREARLVMVDDHITDVPPAGNMLVVSNDDRPGVIGVVGTILGNHNVNIADMDVGKALAAGTAMMVIATTIPTPDAVVEELRTAPGILNVAVLTA